MELFIIIFSPLPTRPSSADKGHFLKGMYGVFTQPPVGWGFFTQNMYASGKF